jgi:hypothetical protein
LQAQLGNESASFHDLIRALCRSLFSQPEKTPFNWHEEYYALIQIHNAILMYC